MKFGLTEQQYQYLQEIVVAPLKNQGATVWIFGSRARGDYQEFADSYRENFETDKVKL
jgi:predicted nucleotidyltransferase